MKNQEFIENYIELCNQTGGISKSGIKNNNFAMKKLEKMFQSINQDDIDVSYVYCYLLNDANENVCLNAAVHCLRLNIFKKESLSKLEHIKENGHNVMIRAKAGMSIMEYRLNKFQGNN